MTLRDSITRRLNLARKANEDDSFKAKALIVCAADPVLWINDWVWTFDPRAIETPKTLPFDLFPRQVEFIRWLEEREAMRKGGLVEKCRDMGVTWLMCAFFMHRWTFRPGFTGGMGSRKLDLVDDLGNPDCIFEKNRFILDHLPAWQLPRGFNKKKHDKSCNLINPETGSGITGEGGDEIGRGGRKTMYFVDESAFLERPLKVEAGLSANTNVKIHVSTYNGTNHFYNMVSSGKHDVFIFDWTEDPRKDQEWYEKQKLELEPHIFAQEVLRDPTASVEGITIPAAWVKAAVGFNAWLHQTCGKFLPMGGDVIGGLDVAATKEGKGDETVLTSRRGRVVDYITGWQMDNTTDSGNKAIELCQQRKIKTLYYDSVGVGVGVKSTFDKKEELSFDALGVNVGAVPTYAIWPDGRTSKDRFFNFKAEMWWKARECFERTWEFREKGIEHPLEDLISIPNNEKLVRQLSTVLHGQTETGKIQIETKKALRARGIKSPDYAESLLLSLIDIPAIQGAY